MNALSEHISAEDYKRLDNILGAFSNKPHGRARLSDCLARMTGRKGEDHLASFRAFRQRLARGAKTAGLRWTLEVDSKKRSEPADRECWFLAPLDDTTAESAAEFSRQETAVLQDQPFIPLRGRPAAGRRLVRFIVSFDEKHDANSATSLLTDLEASFQVSREYEYEIWHQGKILAGEIKAREIEDALARSDFGLLLLTPNRLASFAADVDLRELAESAKPLIPAALSDLSDRHDLHGLHDHQIFRSKGRSFSACRGKLQKEAFVKDLFEEIENRLDRWFDGAETTGSVRRTMREPRARAALAHSKRFDERMARELMSSFAPDPNALGAFVHSSGAEASLAEELDRVQQDRSESRSVDMLEALERWVRDPAGTRYAAILGEYGIGKTTLLRKLTEELLRQRKSDSSLPLPIFIDLRYYSETIQKDARVPKNIEALLQEALDRAWRSKESKVDPEDLLRLVREEGAILIFDGLDEKLVHLTEMQGQAFIRTLWQALPPVRSDAQQSLGESQRTVVPGRLIFSCRSHYFKTLRSQSALFLGEDREGIRSTNYRAWVLLPFNEQQIRLYLGNVIGEERVDAAMELFGAVHNLRDLAQRPYLLSVIVEHIDAIERKRMRGETVTGVTIYNLLVERWLERDNGKHKLQPEDKLLLMEEVAGTMWAQGDRAWPWDRLRDWLGRRLAGDVVLRARYANIAHDILEEDIRTATFVLRPDTSEREFQFAHTSLLEFFLAKYLFRALAAGAIEAWSLPAGDASTEAFDFLGQLILTESDTRIREKCLATLSELLGSTYPDAAPSAFRYWVLAMQRFLPEPRPSRVDLRGADLSNIVVRGRSATERLNLRHADLSGAELVGSVWQDVDLSEASLAGARAERAEFHRVLARDLDVSRANLTGAIWRGSDARGLRGGGTAEWYECHWIDSLVDIESLPHRFGQLGVVSYGHACASGVPTLENAAVIVQRAVLGVTSGHRGPVSACAWSPDGTQMLSGSWDSSLKIWDALTGQELRTLAGHDSYVSACSWSPDGTRLLSGSQDSMLKVWDARTGHELQTLAGHGDSVTACSWSPDGTQVLSGSRDRMLKVWDARTGKELCTFAGHGDSVKACAWSPDGTQLLSGSADDSLKVWDARTGKELRTFGCHGHSVTACSWSPDGTQVLSGFEDDTLKVWDARTGEELHTFTGHGSRVTAYSWSPDGTQVLSGYYDTLKVRDARTGEELRTLAGHGYYVIACAWSGEGTQVLSASLDSTLRMWNVRTGEELRTIAGHCYSAVACAWSPDGMQVLSGSEGDTLNVWDARTGRELRTLAGHRNWVISCAWSPDGTQVLSGSVDKTLKVWDVRTGQELRTLAGHHASVHACAWSPDGAQVLSGSVDKTLKVWDARTGQELMTLAGHFDSVTSCSWSPDGTQVLSGSDDDTLKVWDARTGKELMTIPGDGDGVTSGAWSPDGTQVLSGSYDHTLRVWDARTGKELMTLAGHRDTVTSCAWSPDGTQVLSGSHDHTLRVWDARNGKELRTLEGHCDSVHGCAWSPDGMQLVSGSEDNTLKVWDARTGRLQLTLTNLPNGESAALDLANNRVVWASPGAWRYLGWQFYDEDAKRLRVLPAEHFGPLPSAARDNLSRS